MEAGISFFHKIRFSPYWIYIHFVSFIATIVVLRWVEGCLFLSANEESAYLLHMKYSHMTLLALALLLISCSPVDYPLSTYSSVEEKDLASDDPHWGVERGTRSALVSFSPLEGASSYVLLLNSGEVEKSYSVDGSSFSQGRFSREIRGLEGNTEYSLTLYPVFKGRKVKNTKSFSFTTLDSSSERPEYAPYAYVEKRESDSCTIHFDFLSSMVYRIVLREKGREENVGEYIFRSSGFNDSYKIEGLESGKEYVLTVQHGKKEGEWGVLKKDLLIFAYNASYPPLLELSVDKGVFSLSSTPGELYLLKRGDLSFLMRIETPEAFVIPSSLLTSSERAEYYVLDKSGGRISNAVSYTSPLLPSLEISATSIRVQWESVLDAVYEVEAEPILPNGNRVVPPVRIPEVEVDEEKSSLTLTGLAGSTDYAVLVRAIFPDGNVSEFSETIRTGSFEGTYAWYGYPTDGARSAFVVRVEEAPKESAYPYYIYVSEKDPMFDGTEHRIMPLLDEVDPGYEPLSAPIKYSSQDKGYMKAYRWNAKKWNKTTMSPSEWKPERSETEGNSFTSYVYSKAIGMSLSTKTTFSFQESGGKKSLVFRNMGDGANANFVNVGLFTNREPSPGMDKYSFVLSKVGEEEEAR